MSWHPGRWPLRTRVALAFLATIGAALLALGFFVHVRLSAALDDRLRDTLSAEADRLAAVPSARRSEAVAGIAGEVQAQLLTAEGDVVASSRLVTGRLLDTGSVDVEVRTGPDWREGTVTVLDDDAVAGGREDPERERYALLVRSTADGVLVVGTSREDADEALGSLRSQLLIGGPLALGVAGVLGYVVAGAGLRPIERMRTRAATISARSTGERLPVPGADDELRRLALTLNAMLERLDEGLRRERRFVAEASHDLRTPLTLMLTEIELATAQPRPGDELTGALRSVEEEVRRLIALTDDLLERAGPDDLGLPIESRPVDLVALTARVVERFRAAAGDRAMELTAPRPVEVLGDATRLDRALSNLVDNALRHGAGDIEIAVGSGPDSAVVTVSDEGPGFPPEVSLRSGDPGLGLTIVREIARAHGGTVEVQRGEDHTCVRLELGLPHHRQR